MSQTCSSLESLAIKIAMAHQDLNTLQQELKDSSGWIPPRNTSEVPSRSTIVHCGS